MPNFVQKITKGRNRRKNPIKRACPFLKEKIDERRREMAVPTTPQIMTKKPRENKATG
jgi:hypothetical protein